MPYVKPKLDYLPRTNSWNDSDTELAETYKNTIQSCLSDHGIEVSFEGCKISSINMIFDYSYGSGVKYSEILNRQQDVSLAVGFDVKIFPQNGEHNVFSVSVLRKQRYYVGLRDVLTSDEFSRSASPVTVAAGVDERGRNICFDLAEAPHMMISGTTGSGKTVFLDDIILSFLYKSSPDDVKLVLIDTEAKDFSLYSDIPHLMFPIVTNKENAVEVVKSVKNQMTNRFEQFSKVSVKDIESYNRKTTDNLPRIVIIIDKYMDLTVDIPTEFEDNLSEIARKGRAAGIHLIINTQSARSEIVSNSIKSNITYRAAFSVVDWHESKAIIDKTGAQKLLGNGDMLLTPGTGEQTLHIQAANVSDVEVKEVVKDLKDKNGTATYVDDLNREYKDINGDLDYTKRILLAVSNTKSVSTLSIQKALGISYFEAANAIRFLEQKHVVSSYSFGKGRVVDQTVVDKLLEKTRWY